MISGGRFICRLNTNEVLLKVSGEALAGENKTGLNPATLSSISAAIKNASTWGYRLQSLSAAATSGAGGQAKNMDRTRADHMGMLATVINALALGDALEAKGVATRVQTAIEMRQIAEPYIRGRAMHHLEAGRVVIFGCGTGNPFFSTDTAAALRAAEIDADIILLAKKGGRSI